MYFQTGISENGTIPISMMKKWVSHIPLLKKSVCVEGGGAYRIPGSAAHPCYVIYR